MRQKLQKVHQSKTKAFHHNIPYFKSDIPFSNAVHFILALSTPMQVKEYYYANSLQSTF